MSVPIIAFFGDTGKTFLVYHLAWMYADLDVRVVAADLDPKANLTTAFLDEKHLELLWSEGTHPNTIMGSIQSLLEGTSDIDVQQLENIGESQLKLALLAGDPLLSTFEDELSEAWSRCLDSNKRAFRITSAFYRILQRVAKDHNATVVLVDLDFNFGAINRAALIAADYIVTPLTPDLFSLRSLRNLGSSLKKWHTLWEKRLVKNPDKYLSLPVGHMQAAGYIVLRQALRMDRPVNDYEQWLTRIPEEYREYILNEHKYTHIDITDDPECLALLKPYQSLMPLAQEARKPMFHLKPADGALGSHLQAVQRAYRDFKQLAEKIAERTQITLPRLY